MKKTKHTPSQIIEKLRRVEARVAGGSTVGEAIKAIEVSEQTYYRWKRRYGGMDEPDIRRLRELEKENARLKKVVAEQALDNAILKEALQGKY